MCKKVSVRFLVHVYLLIHLVSELNWHVENRQKVLKVYSNKLEQLKNANDVSTRKYLSGGQLLGAARLTRVCLKVEPDSARRLFSLEFFTFIELWNNNVHLQELVKLTLVDVVFDKVYSYFKNFIKFWNHGLWRKRFVR